MNYRVLLLASLFITLTAMESRKAKPEKPPKQLQENFVLIPHQAYMLEPEFANADFQADAASASKTVSVPSFFCAKTEVSNYQYRQFLGALKQQGKSADYAAAKVDSLNWKQPDTYGEPYAEYYHAHPAYDRYPVVNVSHRGALLYCTWLENQLNADPEDLNVYKVSLPTREQWVAAAKGGIAHSPYPWGGPALVNAKGCTLANFKFIGAENIHFNTETNSYEIMPSSRPYSGRVGINSADVTAPVSSYSPNDYGVFNMSGNVAEMIADEGIACGGGWRSTGFDVRCVSTMKYEKPQSDIGFRPTVRIVR